jgi:hypothetical protein
MTITITNKAATVLAALFVLILVVGGANLWATFLVNQASVQRVCNGFAYFIHPPSAPTGSTLYRHEQTQFNNLLVFEGKLGCKVNVPSTP